MAKRGQVPNVVLFVTDQQRADTMPGVRKAAVETPHLEWLGERSTLFTRGYCTDPMCSPARSSIFTGLYPHTNGLVANYHARPISNEIRLSSDFRVLADYLRPQGYACAYTGKWHLATGSDRRGFKEFTTRWGVTEVERPEDNEILQFVNRVGLPAGYKQRGCDPNPTDYDARTTVGSSLMPLAWFPSTQDAVQASRFIREMEHDERPLLLVYSCNEPHPPFVSPRPFDRMYSPEAMPLPETRRSDDGPRILRYRPDFQLKPAAPYSDDDLRRMWAAYYGAISFLDHLLGTVLAALVATDRFDDTLFVFTSDHGEMLGSHGLLHKGAALYEELVRVPFMIKPPQGLGMAHQTDRLVTHADLVPTILKWCGVDVPDHLQGVDMRSLVEGGDKPVHDGVALEFYASAWGEQPSPLRGWVTEDWKYVETIGGDDELYDLRSDPLETRNLIGDPSAQHRLGEMKAALHSWMERTDDRWPEVPLPRQFVPKESGGPWHLYR